MEFAENLMELLEEKDVTAYRLSKETGFSQSLISDWKKGKSVPNSGKLVTLAEYFGVTTDRLLGKDREESSPSGGMLLIPVLGEIRAGEPIFCQENIEGYELANVKKPEDYFYLRVKGDSMVGAGIRDGSLVLVRKQNHAENGQIVACLVDGELATLKRFKQQGDMIILMPENSAYEPVIVRAADFEENSARILGVAVSVTTAL